jgi:hypothetical protein
MPMAMKTITLVFLAGITLLAPGSLAADAVRVPPVALEAIRPFSFQLGKPARIEVPRLSAISPAPAPTAEPVRLAAIEVKGRPDFTYRELNTALAWEKLGESCNLLIGSNAGSVQVRALGAPEPPLEAEAGQPGQRANFPIVTLAW